MTPRLFLSTFLIITCIYGSGQSLQLAENGSSGYRIFLPPGSSKIDIKAANVLQHYFYLVTGVNLPVENKQPSAPAFIIGGNASMNDKEINGLPEDGYVIRTSQKNILIAGNSGKGTLYGVYEFIEKYMGCKKWDGHAAYVPKKSFLFISSAISDISKPVLQYREVYLPPAFDDEYLDWHKLHRFEIDWGIWGHSFFKLTPPSVCYRTHPEYFSLVNGQRKPIQLCLSNAAVLKIVIEKLQKLMDENPGAKYWSVSPNDDNGNCECDNCCRLDLADGGPQGSLIHFVNAVAAHFPNKIITTLAYGYSARATIKTNAASNVVIILSSIDAYRTKPLETEQTSAAFRNNILHWKEKASHVFVWDYCTQFTNYLTPFPITHNFRPNINFLIQHGITGIFEQGSGNTLSDMAELKAYVCAKLLWNPSADSDSLTTEFLKGYYGKAASVIDEYLSLLKIKMLANDTRLDIYGNPVNDHDGYLSPENMDAYSHLMDQAEQLLEDDPTLLKHVTAIRLSQEYVYLQQAKFFGKDKHGLFQKNANGEFVLRTGLPERIKKFTALSKEQGVKEFSEGGISPEKYSTQWHVIITKGPQNNLAANATVRLSDSYALEYPSKKERTLVDETPGYEDFSYNWLCFYGVSMEAILDMGSIKKVNTISLNFLEDPRHWVFAPSGVSLQVSADGNNYHTINSFIYPMPEENYTVSFLSSRFPVNEDIRYIRVKATNWPALPTWRYHKYKKPMIACDEVWVE